MVKTYVVAPTLTIAPPPKISDAVPPTPEARLQLGDIISDPFGPEMVALNRDARIPIKESLLEKADIKGGFQATRRELLSGRLGVCASILAALGLGTAIDISIFAQKNSTEIIKAQSIETHELRITDQYLKDVLATDPLKAYRASFESSKLYVISAMKIVKGASVKINAGFQMGADVGGGDPTGTVDVKLLKFLWKRSNGVSFDTSTDFILAVQLRLLKFEGDNVTALLSTKKATLADGSAAPEAEYEGTADDLSHAKEEFDDELLEKKEDADNEEFVIPEID